jgi:hypothetical protein
MGHDFGVLRKFCRQGMHLSYKANPEAEMGRIAIPDQPW